MCSICGFSWEDKELVRAMNKLMSFRGPDGSGIYTDINISLGHNRLSILDLSKAGRQPMANKKENLIIAYNGEIYNFKEIRAELQKHGYNFDSGTDTEVILNAYDKWGYGCLSYFNGMFAFAIWDKKKKELFLARDRLGVKPLYYLLQNNNIIFSSEIKAMALHDIKKHLNYESLNSFLTYRFITSDDTMIKGIKKLMPGHYAVFKAGNLSINKYWDLSWKISKADKNSLALNLKKLIESAVEYRLISDVPIGAFLSGGLDSSLVAAINTKLRNDAVKTFTVGFGHETDEFRYARSVSENLKTEHNELLLDYKEITKELPKIIWHMDEPNSDITMVPLYFLSKFAKKQVTVVNTGEGADELFSGYHHYRVGANSFRIVPKFIKTNLYNWYYQPFKKKDRNALLCKNVREDKSLKSYLNGNYPGRPRDFLNRILCFDIKNELPNWQLARVDRMSMAHGLEARVPFLDYRIVEFSTTLPVRYKQPFIQGKYLLKKAAKSYLPKEIIHRKKQGFTTPMHAWIKDNLEDAAESVLLQKKDSAFRQKYITELIAKHRKTHKQRPFQLFSYRLLMLLFYKLWHEMYIEGKSIRETKNILNI